MGKGATRVLFRGALEVDGHVLTENDIADAAAKDAGFWQYVDAAVRAKRIPEQSGMWSWKLAVRFLNQDGMAATIDGTDATSRVTAEEFEFFRGCTERTSGELSALQLARDVLVAITQQQAQAALHTREMFREAFERSERMLTQSAATAQATIVSATAEAQKVLAAGAEPLRHTVDRVCDQAQRESTRADDATRDVCTLLRQGQKDENPFADLTNFVSAAGVVIPVVKKVLN